MMRMTKRGAAAASVAAALCLTAAACSSSGSTTAAGGSSASSTSSASSGGSGTVPQVTLSQLPRYFSAMATLKPLASEGKGNVAVLLPDTVSSARYTEFDAPYLTQALTAAGLTSSQFTVQNAQGMRVETGKPHLVGGDTHLAVDLKPLPPGTYTVVWHATATDTHKTQGTFQFTVSSQ